MCRPLGSALTLSNDDHSIDDDDENNDDHGDDDVYEESGQLCRPLGSALTLGNDDHSDDDDDSMINNDDGDDNDKKRSRRKNISGDNFLRKGQPGSTTSWTSPTGCQSMCHRKHARPENYRKIIKRLVYE